MSVKHLLASAALVTAGLSTITPAYAGSDPYVGEIMLVGYTFCPRGTVEANGQLLPISQNTALFSLYGTTYGGDGRTSFGLPDLRGRTVIHNGHGPGLSNRQIGRRGGSETNMLNFKQMPASAHTGDVQTSTDTQGTPNPLVAGNRAIQAQNNMQPYLALKYCVALVGVYPSRS